MTATSFKWKAGITDAPILTRALSVALLVCSALWLAGAGVYYAMSGFQHTWSATPAFWMMIVTVAPAICFTIGGILLNSRPSSGFSWLDRCALMAAFLPVTLGSILAIWVVKILFAMIGLG